MVDIDLDKLTYEAVVIQNELAQARDEVVKPIMAALLKRGYCTQDQFALRLGLEEAITNAYRHGNACDPTRRIHVRWSIDEALAVIRVADEGRGFNPSRIPDPRKAENREKPSGRGVMLMRAYMTDLRFTGCGNEVCLIKARKKSNRSSRRVH